MQMVLLVPPFGTWPQNHHPHRKDKMTMITITCETFSSSFSLFHKAFHICILSNNLEELVPFKFVSVLLFATKTDEFKGQRLFGTFPKFHPFWR